MQLYISIFPLIKEIVDAMGKRVIAIENGHIVRDEASGVYGYEL